MKIGCCWMYAIELYGYPPSMADSYKALKRMSDMGFEYVEMEAFGLGVENIGEIRKEKKKLKRFIDDIGVKIVNFPIILPGLVNIDANERKKSFELFEKGLEVAEFLGVELVQLDSFTPALKFMGDVPYHESLTYGKQFKVKIDQNFSWQKQWDAVVESFSKCNEKLKKAGIKMTVEPRVGEIISNTDALLRLMEAVNDTNLGAVLEAPHLHAQKEILPLSVEKLGGRIYYLHLADNDSRDNLHNKIGEGTVDWEGLFTALKKHHFEGYGAIDVRPHLLKEIDKEYIESKIFVEKLAKKLFL